MRKYISGRPSRPGADEAAEQPEPAVGAEHVLVGRVGQDDRAPHRHEVGDPVGARARAPGREHQHPAQAVADPVDPVVAGLALHVVEDRRDVVANASRRRSTRPRPISSRSVCAEPRVDVGRPCRPAALARAAEVEDEDLVAPRGELGGEVVVGDRPEGAVEPQAVAEHHRQLARVGDGRGGWCRTPSRQPSAVSAYPSVQGRRSGDGPAPHRRAAGDLARTRTIAPSGPEIPSTLALTQGVLPTLARPILGQPSRPALGLPVLPVADSYQSAAIRGMRGRDSTQHTRSCGPEYFAILSRIQQVASELIRDSTSEPFPYPSQSLTLIKGKVRPAP